MLTVKQGLLVLVPTPLQANAPLETEALSLLKKNISEQRCLIVVEELKVARKRWIQWGLPRETIEHFFTYNEHSSNEDTEHIIRFLQQEKGLVFLLSDAGLPVFSDPGQQLVDRCHHLSIPVISTPIPNSLMGALILSGFSLTSFFFGGFLPQKTDQRQQRWRELGRIQETFAVMDTPYRIQNTLEELKALPPNRQAFLAMDLYGSHHFCKRFYCGDWKKLSNLPKAPFVLVIGPLFTGQKK